MQYIDFEKLHEDFLAASDRLTWTESLITSTSNELSQPNEALEALVKSYFDLKSGTNLNTQVANRFVLRFMETVYDCNRRHGNSIIGTYESCLWALKHTKRVQHDVNNKLQYVSNGEWAVQAQEKMRKTVLSAEAAVDVALKEVRDIQEMGSIIGVDVTEFNKKKNEAEKRVNAVSLNDNADYLTSLITHSLHLKLRSCVEALGYSTTYAQLIYAAAYFCERIKGGQNFNWHAVGGVPSQVSVVHLQQKLQHARNAGIEYRRVSDGIVAHGQEFGISPRPEKKLSLN